MSVRRFVSFPTLLGATLALGLASLVALPAASAAKKEASREEQIADLERQIAELTRRLAELKATAAKAPAPKAEAALPADWAKALHWRPIGPASMGGRIVALAVYAADPSTYWVATASGGLLKTTNNGTTFKHQFDREATVSIGDVAVAPSNKDVVWVGTGENNPRNSVSYGDGVYKSTDGGTTWKNMGLKKSFQIGKVLIHPKNPDVVYVGALGRLYGPGGDRGVFKTADGGKTWNKVLTTDDKTGVIDMRMHPTEPDTLLVATWERQRDGFDSHAGAMSRRFGGGGAKVDPPMPDGYDAYDPTVKWGPGGGIFKTTDGGKTFKKLTKGLPSGATGRIGLDYYLKDPNVVFAIIDCDKIGMGTPPTYLGVIATAGTGGARLTRVTEGSPAAKAGLKADDVVTAADKKPVKDFDELGKAIMTHRPGDKMVLSVLRDKKPLEITATLSEHPEFPGAGQTRLTMDFFGVSDTSGGVQVTRVQPAAAKAGLQVGDVIEAIDKKKVKDMPAVIEVYRAAKPGDTLALQVKRGKETKELKLEVPRPAPTRRPYAAQYGGQQANVQDWQGPDGHQYGGVYKSTDGGESWTRINSVNPRPMYFSQVRVDPSDSNYLYVLGVRLIRSTDGGKTFEPGGDASPSGPTVHADQHAMWINPKDGRHILLGTDGGTYVTYDRCGAWDFLNSMAIAQFYHVCVDSRRPYRVYGGLQDNGSWGGPSHSLDGRGPINADWVMVGSGDGFVCRVDPTNPDIVYYESQDGSIRRRDLKTDGRGPGTTIHPLMGLMRRGGGGRGAGERPGGGAGSPAPSTPAYRFNWNTPFIISSHNPSIFYSAGNYVFRSVKRGDELKAISPEITKSGKASATALAESPRNPDVLWAGTDDGNLWVTRDGGAKWTNVAAKVGLPKSFWVSTIEASRFAEGRAYVAFDAHRSDDDDPYVYVTEDYGQTWKSLRGNLPTGSSRVLREDIQNRDVLYLGTEFAVWASVDRGGSWTKINGDKLNNKLPTVAVHELAQHPTAGEMVAATHGRSIWILDVTPLRQMTAKTAKEAVTLFAPTPAIRWRGEVQRGTIYGRGHREFVGENPVPGAHVYYTLTKKADKARVVIQDYSGKTVATLPGRVEPGLHKVTWNLRVGAEGTSGGRTGGPRGGRGGIGGGGTPAPAGTYRVVLTVDGKEYTQGLRVENDPTLPATTILADGEAEEAPEKKEEAVKDR